MKTRSSERRRTLVAMAAVAAVALGVLAQPMSVGAQPTRGKKKADKPRTESTQTQENRLTDEQRARVQEIVREHREESRKDLREKLSTVLTPEQLDMFEQRFDGGRAYVDRGGRGMRGGDSSRHGRHDFRSNKRWNRGDRCDCCRGEGSARGDGPHPRMGEFRGERGDRMVEHLAVVLDLTKEQHEKVAGIVREHHEQFKDFDPSTLSFDERQKTREAHQTLLKNRIKEVLTPEQAEKFEALHDTLHGPHHGGMKG